jgi:VWFA-related protein
MAIPVPTLRHGLLLSILLFCPAISLGAAGNPPEFTYRANATEVRLTFSALDQNNHGVATLQASDFAVVDKDVIVRNFQSFTRSDWTKLEIAVLLDASESVSPHFRREIADTVDLVSQTAGVPDENLSIFSFHGLEPAILCAGDCRASHATDRLPAARPGGLTPLFDTIVFASDFLAHHGDAHAQKILIVFSDGEDTISRNSLRDAIASAQQSEIQIDCINLNNSAALTRGAAVLYNLADATGGGYFPSRTGAATALNVILEGFRATYTITYRLPSHASGFHAVRILPTRNLNLQFRSRSGYYFPNYTR